MRLLLRTFPWQQSYPGVAQLVARMVRVHEAVGSNPATRTSFSRQYRCRGLKAHGINCFRGFDALKIQVSSDRCQQRFSRNWRGLNL